MSPEDLREVGAALYGAAWQSDLARALEINPRRVREWLAGERSMPKWLPEALHLLWTTRAEAARKAVEAIYSSTAP